MKLDSVFRVVFSSFARNKVRSFLTTLGIIIGVAAVITMFSIGQGSKERVAADIASLGTNTIIVMPGALNQSGIRQVAGTASRLTEDDVAAIKSQCGAVQYVSPEVRTAVQVKYGSYNWRTQMNGVYPDFINIRNWPLESGRGFTDAEVRSAAKVCLIGQTLATNVFPDQIDPVGKIIKVQNVPFTVIGTLSSKGQTAMGPDQDDCILVPFSTVQKRIIRSSFVGVIIASAASSEVTEEARQEIYKVLDLRHGNSSESVSQYTIGTQTDLSNTAEKTSKTLGMLLVSIAFVSLIVGGIGIMNIMLVSVTERTREIGIRMAVGARERDIMLQFLVEATTLSVAGGIIGILAGAGASILVSNIQGWPVKISMLSIALGFGFSAAIGIFFGWYPAQKAAALNPIEALRYE
ncbi:MAG: hypothetical protein A2487_02155 [Candidatus Raymondbacteria bacterium RifOxyC12_full_50_8]|uniref:Multidrug ABC transporter substrate-binding protein n=1 Tax=Candidatus Raymondbacteria bacterium RIFOXYD12_FULL_49_13 TaxID=1817890 RepID=A0A1F7FHB8_UNCRA|nr:MAG: hypothetical protein A2248_00815 [Candidatus Raymondbacteria bacterium RIFOXYA2_FULL_49_16]OGK04882.1 MAG: hypothetical protein A2487_02155 [Candidatus Raymondbacteria bacterium RifOxyC12_full_50_8]OGK06013.1 MAG: hypothetical protein A2519_14685 [Candidatus Raymondbacteria bacterium RIFOXYD12_FULL_49_13]OGP42247.1 MAG: hypothetical protein A2324_01360 [Candidatus Raymondbacteria bacterium RIFOXYB2_FULL_49_35]